MARRVEPEWLDELAADDARAHRSRRDLVRVNALMANAGIVARELRLALPRRDVRIAEVGAGDGAFALRVLRRLPQHGTVTLVDRQAAPDVKCLEALRRAGWQPEVATADVFDWLRGAVIPAEAGIQFDCGARLDSRLRGNDSSLGLRGNDSALRLRGNDSALRLRGNDGSRRYDAIFANLFLHHFEPEPLAELLRLVAQRTGLFVACEPRRSPGALLGARLLGVIGCSEVTQHDAAVSVRAGFSGGELSELWGARPGWLVEERPRALFSHGFVAKRA